MRSEFRTNGRGRRGRDGSASRLEPVIKTERETAIPIRPGLQIRYRRSEAPPPFAYAITLECEEDGTWVTVRLWDNADGVDEHHEHLHTRSDGKQEPSILAFGSPNEAMATAIDQAKAAGEEMVRQWRAS